MFAFRLCLFLLSNSFMGICKTEEIVTTYINRNLEDCICFPKGGSFFPQQLSPNENGIQRLVVYIDRDIKTNKIRAYTRNPEGQTKIPNIPINAGNGFAIDLSETITSQGDALKNINTNIPNKDASGDSIKVIPDITKELDKNIFQYINEHQNNYQSLQQILRPLNNQPKLNVDGHPLNYPSNNNFNVYQLNNLNPYQPNGLTDILKRLNGQQHEILLNKLIKSQTNNYFNPLKPNQGDITNKLLTFHQWFHHQLEIFRNDKLIKDMKEIDTDILRLLVQKVLFENNMHIDSRGLITDNRGTLINFNNIELRPILIGNPVTHTKNLQTNFPISENLPYLEGILITLIYPPKILGVIPLRNTYRNTKPTSQSSREVRIEHFFMAPESDSDGENQQATRLPFSISNSLSSVTPPDYLNSELWKLVPSRWKTSSISPLLNQNSGTSTKITTLYSKSKTLNYPANNKPLEAIHPLVTNDIVIPQVSGWLRRSNKLSVKEKKAEVENQLKDKSEGNLEQNITRLSNDSQQYTQKELITDSGINSTLTGKANEDSTDTKHQPESRRMASDFALLRDNHFPPNLPQGKLSLDPISKNNQITAVPRVKSRNELLNIISNPSQDKWNPYLGLKSVKYPHMNIFNAKPNLLNNADKYQPNFVNLYPNMIVSPPERKLNPISGLNWPYSFVPNRANVDTSHIITTPLHQKLNTYPGFDLANYPSDNNYSINKPVSGSPYKSKPFNNNWKIPSNFYLASHPNNNYGLFKSGPDLSSLFDIPCNAKSNPNSNHESYPFHNSNINLSPGCKFSHNIGPSLANTKDRRSDWIPFAGLNNPLDNNVRSKVHTLPYIATDIPHRTYPRVLTSSFTNPNISPIHKTGMNSPSSFIYPPSTSDYQNPNFHATASNPILDTMNPNLRARPHITDLKPNFGFSDNIMNPYSMATDFSDRSDSDLNNIYDDSGYIQHVGSSGPNSNNQLVYNQGNPIASTRPKHKPRSKNKINTYPGPKKSNAIPGYLTQGSGTNYFDANINDEIGSTDNGKNKLHRGFTIPKLGNVVNSLLSMFMETLQDGDITDNGRMAEQANIINHTNKKLAEEEIPDYRIIGGSPATGSGAPLNNKGRSGNI